MIEHNPTASKIRLKTVILIGMIIVAGLVVITLGLSRRAAFAQDQIELPEIGLTQVASGLARPIHITHAGDDSNRLFIVEQSGRILILQDELSNIPFLDISDRVASPDTGGGNEEGLLSVAFPPSFTERGQFYVYYTMRNGDNVVSRFSVTDDRNLADPDSEETIILLPHPLYNNHNGGQLAFSPDGYLYIATGDGGGGGDPLDNGQDPSSINGKLLRIDVEMENFRLNTGKRYSLLTYRMSGCASPIVTPGQTYAIPTDNPFINDPNYHPEIWALGLRNPWRFSFDRQTGDLYIADVGQNRWEEINFQPANSPGGENYGWNIMEGEECYRTANCETEGLTMPVHVYPIFSTSDCSVTGGFVYRGEQYPELEGLYIFGDFCSGRIWGLQQEGSTWQSGLLANTNFRISTFGEDEFGELYLADLSSGSIYQITLP